MKRYKNTMDKIKDLEKEYKQAQNKVNEFTILLNKNGIELNKKEDHYFNL